MADWRMGATGRGDGGRMDLQEETMREASGVEKTYGGSRQKIRGGEL